MSAEQVRETLMQYVEVLLARGEYGRFFDDDIEFVLMGTDQQRRGAQAAEQTIRFLHEIAFDAEPEITSLVVDDPRRGRGGVLRRNPHRRFLRGERNRQSRPCAVLGVL
jgi:hypothetical protein